METLHFVGYVYIGDFSIVLVSFCYCIFSSVRLLRMQLVNLAMYIHTYVLYVFAYVLHVFMFLSKYRLLLL